jgi:hypothetical protein
LTRGLLNPFNSSLEPEGTRARSGISPHSKGPAQHARCTLRILRSAKCYDRPALSASSFPEWRGCSVLVPFAEDEVPTSLSDRDRGSFLRIAGGSAACELDRQRAREKSSKKWEGCESRHANRKVDQLARAPAHQVHLVAAARRELEFFFPRDTFSRVSEEEEKKRKRGRRDASSVVFVGLESRG